MRKYKQTAGELGRVSRDTYQVVEETKRRVAITALCNGCSGEPLAPTVAPLVAACSVEDLDHLEVEYTHSRRDPSSAVRCTCLVEAGLDTVDEHRCSVALDVSGGDECEIVAANRSWSSEAGRQTSVQECSSEGEQAQG